MEDSKSFFAKSALYETPLFCLHQPHSSSHQSEGGAMGPIHRLKRKASRYFTYGLTGLLLMLRCIEIYGN